MRKLTRKEVAAVSAVLGIFSVGAKHAFACSESGANGQPCELQQITVHAYSCPDCEYIPPVWYAPPSSTMMGPSYTPGSGGSSGGSVPPFNPANNPHCATPGVDKGDIQSTIRANEGTDANVSALGAKNYGYSWMTNETGYVPAKSYLTPYPNSGVTVNGVDLSKWWPWQLEQAGAPSSLFTPDVDSLMTHLVWSGGYGGEGTPSPYAPTGDTALLQLYDSTNGGVTPLFTVAGGQEIFQAAYNAVLGNVQNSIGSVSFGQLPDGTQTAIMDFAWNQDAGYLSSNATVRDDIRDEDWLSLGSYLLNQNNVRLALDGAAILADIKAGKLPEQGGPC